MIFVSIHTYYMSWNLYTHHQRKHVDDPRHQPSQQGSVINTPPPRRWASESLWALGCNLESTHVKSAKLYRRVRRVLWRIDHLQDTCLVRLVVLVVASNMAICRKDSTAEEAISSQTSHSICGRSPFLSLRRQTATSWWHILKHVCACFGLSCWYCALYWKIVIFKYHRICMSRTSSKQDFLSRRAEINVLLCWWTTTSTSRMSKFERSKTQFRLAMAPIALVCGETAGIDMIGQGLPSSAFDSHLSCSQRNVYPHLSSIHSWFV